MAGSATFKYLVQAQAYVYRARLIGGPQVARMLQASWGRSGKQEQEQNSQNLGPAY